MSLKINEKIGYKKGIATSLNNIGLIYWNLSNYDKTLEYYQKSLKIFEELENKRHIAHLLNNIGIVYKSLNDQDKALDYYLRSLKIKEQLGDKKGIANSLGNIGIIYKNLKKYDESLKYYLKALEMTEEIDDKWGTANTLNNIGNLYVKQQKYDKAFLYLENGLKLAKEIKTKSNINNSYFFFSELFSAKKDYKKALEYFKLYSAVKDSIFTEESSNKIVEMQTKYETEQKDKENQLLKKDLEISGLQKSRLIFLLLGSVLILAVMIIFLIQRVRIDHRLRITNKDLAISKENTEQIRKQLALINSMLRHDLSNNFIVIKTALQLYNEEKDEKMLKEADIKCNHGLELINSMRELEFNHGDNTFLKPIDLKQVIDKLSPEFSSMNILLHGNCKVYADEAFESVIHNIFENAHLHGKAKNITITFEEFSDFTEIKIHNDGLEIPEDINERIFEKQFSQGEASNTGMGLFLVQQNINRYGGSIYVEDNDKPGVTFVINLKKG
jgi:signal transduction histidine kinase